MTNDEEKLIADVIYNAQRDVEALEKKKRAIQHDLNHAKSFLEDANQAALDYMQETGLVECDAFKLRTSYRVDVEDIASVPEDYLRVKTTTEINKQKIRADKPQANWYTLTPNYSVEVL